MALRALSRKRRNPLSTGPWMQFTVCWTVPPSKRPRPDQLRNNYGYANKTEPRRTTPPAPAPNSRTGAGQGCAQRQIGCAANMPGLQVLHSPGPIFYTNWWLARRIPAMPVRVSTNLQYNIGPSCSAWRNPTHRKTGSYHPSKDSGGYACRNRYLQIKV